jgi:putative endonuclease
MANGDPGLSVGDKDNTSGKQAEALAEQFLVRQGLQVLERNFRCRGGEIDLICRERKVLVFVEVRLRRNANYGGAAASITPGKQARIILAARHYLSANRATENDCRFDCVLLDGLDESRIEWMRNAFSEF